MADGRVNNWNGVRMVNNLQPVFSKPSYVLSAEVARLVQVCLDEVAEKGITLKAVSDRITELMGFPVSPQQIQGWADPNRDRFNISAAHMPAFEVACDTTRLTEWLAKQCDGTAVFGKDVLFAQFGKLLDDRNQMDETISCLQSRIEKLSE